MMKQLATAIATCGLLLSFSIPADIAQAQTEPSPTENPANGSGITEAENAILEAEASAGDGECSIMNPLVCIWRIPAVFLTVIAGVLLHFASYLLFLAGTIFNWVVIRTVLEFGTYFGASEGLLLSWSIIRDIANIGLLFGFIFMGVLLILNVGGGHGHGHGHGGIDPKRAIPRLIIFAVLLNFSLFASQFVIDVSNAFSSSLAVLAADSRCSELADGEAGASQSAEECASKYGISGRVAQVAGVTGIFDPDVFTEGGPQTLVRDGYRYPISLMMLSLFVLITAMVLFAGAIMLIVRAVYLVLLMITSPIGFAGMAIPRMEGLAAAWWQKLISQSFFAPVYLLMMFISIKISEGFIDGDATLAQAIIGNAGNGMAGNMQVVMVFLIVIGLMLASLIAASKIGAAGSAFATNAASSLVFGATTRATNFGIGGGARGLRYIQERYKVGGAAGEAIVNRALRPIERANLDFRNLPGVAGGLKQAGATIGANAAGHATYGEMAHQLSDKLARKRSNELHDEYEQERILQNIDAKHGHDLIEEEENKLKKLAPKDLAKLHSLNAIAGSLSDGQFNALMKEKDLLNDGQKAELKEARVKAQIAKAKDMTIDQFNSAMKNENFNSVDKDGIKTAYLASLQASAATMTPEQAEAVLKSDQLNAADKEIVKEMRFGELIKALEAKDVDNIKRLTDTLTKKDLNVIPNRIVMQEAFRDAMSDQQRDDFAASDSRTTDEKTLVKASYTVAKINNEFKATGSVAPVIAQIGNLTPAQIAKLDAGILTDKAMSGSLNRSSLKEIIDNKKLTSQQLETLGKNIRSNPDVMADEQMQKFLDGPVGSML